MLTTTWIRCPAAAAVVVVILLRCATAEPLVRIDSPMPPPPWALLERELLRANTAACEEFFRKYFDERGFLLCVERWGGDDGPDDAIENCNDWPLLYAIGAPEIVRQMYEKAWEGHLRQYTLAKTTHVPLAREGMYYKEFPTQFDWMHNGEGLTVFNLMGLCNPHDPAFARRVRRYAGFYMNEDPGAPNYDPKHKIIKSLFNGSRGPLLRKATALDWTGDPIEVENRFRLGHGERTYQEMLDHFQDYTDVIGDHPQNLRTTVLALNAFALTQEPKYKHWLLEYVDAWAERAKANGDILPSNIGLDGKIGGATHGKWYGGAYGWGFSPTVPQTGKIDHRNRTQYGWAGFRSAFLLTGDDRYLDVWRKQIDAINAQRKMIDGRWMYPRMHGDGGWYAWTRQPYAENALELYCLSMREDDAKRAGSNDWLDYLAGKNAGYPQAMLEADLARVRGRVQAMRADPTTPDTRLADDPMKFNPASVQSLLALTMGAVHPGVGGNSLVARLRYFDVTPLPPRSKSRRGGEGPGESGTITRRPGLPADVAALVTRLTADEADVTLVNINQIDARELIIQGGAYAEHAIVGVTAGTVGVAAATPLPPREGPGEGHATANRDSSRSSPHLRVHLAPGAGANLTLRFKRHVNPPRFAPPW